VGSSRHGEFLGDGCVHARWRDNARRTGSVLEGGGSASHVCSLFDSRFLTKVHIQRMSMMSPMEELPITKVMATVLGFIQAFVRLSLPVAARLLSNESTKIVAKRGLK
jgi:hypothetical protein